MSANFTPGPWKVRIEELTPGGKVGFVVVTDAFDVISGHLAIRRVSDADLIAAAPRMYEAARWLSEVDVVACAIKPGLMVHPDCFDRVSERGEYELARRGYDAANEIEATRVAAWKELDAAIAQAEGGEEA